MDKTSVYHTLLDVFIIETGCIQWVKAYAQVLFPGHQEIAKDIVQFPEERATVVPLKPEWYHDSTFFLSSFFTHLIQAKSIPMALDNADKVIYQDEDGILTLDFSSLAAMIGETTRQAGQVSFIVESYSEWADVPDEHIYVTVVDGKVIHDACSVYDGELRVQSGPFETLRTYHYRMGLANAWYGKQVRYFSFEKASAAYENLKSKHH